MPREESVTAENTQQVVFIDSRVPDIQGLLGGLRPGEQAFVIDSSSDGVQQIADILAANNFTNLASISVVSHGEAGELALGSSFITDGNLAAHSNALAEIGAALAPGGNLQLYGCDVAQGPGGQQLINDLSTFAGGVVVEAATHSIGSAGGWSLDAVSGAPAGVVPQPTSSAAAPATVPFTAAALANFPGALGVASDPQLWIAAGSSPDEIVHVDDVGGTATNPTTLYAGSTAIQNIQDVVLDPTDQAYFVLHQNVDGSEQILEGSLGQALDSPSAAPTFATVFTDASFGHITQIALDTVSHQIYFTENFLTGSSSQETATFQRINYDGTGLTTLGTIATGQNAGAVGFALDLNLHEAVFGVNVGGFISFSQTVAPTSFLYEATGLGSAATSLSITQLPLGNSGTFALDPSLGFFTQDGGLAIDPTTHKLYFTLENGPSDGGLFEYDLAANPNGNINTVWQQTAAGPTGAPVELAIDPTTGEYFIGFDGGNSVTTDQFNGLWRGQLSSTAAPTSFLAFPDTGSVEPFELALDQQPTLSITPSNPTFTESTLNPAATNNTPVALVSSAAAIDPDNSALVSASVSIGGFFVGDVLSATTSGTSIAASYDASAGVLVLSGADSLANYQAVLASLAFTSTSDNPTDFGADTARVLTWTVNDGLLDSAPQTETVIIIGVNDAPTLAGTTNASFTENGSAVTLSPAATVSDPDGLTLAGATVAITGGTLAGDGDVLAANIAGTAITASYDAATEALVLSGSDTLAHYQSVLDSVTFVTASDNPDGFGADPTRTMTWTLDDGSASNATSSVTTTVSITAVNDPPTLAGTANASFTENGAPLALSPAASVTDPDNLDLAGATVAITGGTFAGDGDVLAANIAGTAITASYNAATETLVLSGSDTLAHYQSVLDSVTFVTASDNPDDFGADPTRTMTWTLDDGSASNAATSATTTVSITAVNDPPTLAGTANASFAENGPPLALSPAASVTDPDSLDLAGATVAITGGAFAGDGDVLAANIAGTAIAASYNAATETLVLLGSDTLAHYQSVLDSVTFVTASDNPDDFGADPTRTVTWQLDDGSGSNNLSAVSTTVSITAVNDPPTLSDVAANASYTEQAAATTLSGSLAVSDPDSLALAGATVQIAGGTFAGDGDVLAADTSGTAIIASYDAATETLVLSGADSLADYQSVLDSVTFFDASDNPTNFGSNATRMITWVVADGSASNGTSSVATTTLNVTAVNDAPTLAGVPSTAAFSAGETLTVAPAASVSDPDNLTLASATVRVTGGTFAGDSDVLAANTSGTGITASYNAAVEMLTLTGSDTLAHYQQVLDSVTFTTGANPTNFGLDPTRTLTWTIDDGSGSNNTATATTTISIAANLVKNDLNGDGKSDILFQERVGPLHGPTLIDFMNGTSVAAQATLAGPGITWQLVGSGDFNVDGKADILWQNIDGTPQIWTMNGSTVTSETTLPDPGITWHAVGTGDFNGDGTSDIVFQNLDGTPQIWTMNGTSVASTVTLPDPGITSKLIGTGDLNGDGKSDLVFQKPNGTPTIWLMNGTSVTSTATLPKPSGAGSWQLIGTGDFNGDGDADLLFQKANGTPMIWTMNGTSVAATATLANPGAQWNAIGTGDYNGDGKSDILFQSVNGTPMVWTMNGTSVTATATLPNPGATWHASTG
jgi:lipopolysaccharide export system protein LptA